MSIKERARQLKTNIPAVFIAMRKKETPRRAKVLAVLTVAYALSPIDLIPDFIPVLGLLDDVIILPGMIALTVKLIPAEVFAECQKEAEGLWADGKPKKWYCALPIVARITVRIGSDFKARVEKTAEELGMNLTTAITMFLFQMERDKALPFKPSITTARRGLAGLSQGELDAAVRGAVRADRERGAGLGLPEARYDAAANRAFLAYPDGRREYVDGNG